MAIFMESIFCILLSELSVEKVLMKKISLESRNVNYISVKEKKLRIMTGPGGVILFTWDIIDYIQNSI